MGKVAIITGITGQDGSYLADLLLSHGYKVIGLVRRSSTDTSGRVKYLTNNHNFSLDEFDLTDPSSCLSILEKHKPDELYNLAAIGHVGTSFQQPSTTIQIDTIGVVNLLEAIRRINTKIKFYQASTSEMFGANFSTRLDPTTNTLENFQDESTPFAPQSPYAIAKLASHRFVQIYREAYGLHASSGILFNHESPRRGENFVTRKITNYIGKLVNKKIDQKLHLGNIQAKRDWGHAKDYVLAMYLMVQNKVGDDYVVSTGLTYTVEHFLQQAFSIVDLDYKNHIYIDPQLYRPCEVNFLRGDSSKAKKQLGWQPKISFEDLVKEMVRSDVERNL